MVQRQFLLSCLFSMILLISISECRPHPRRKPLHLRQMDKKTDNDTWRTALDELRTAQEELLSKCSSASECRRLFEGLRAILDRHRLSSKYLDQDNDSYGSIFKWG